MGESPRSARCGSRELPAAGKPALQKKSPEGFIPPGLFFVSKIESEPNQAIRRARASGKTFPEFKRVSGITSS